MNICVLHYNLLNGDGGHFNPESPHGFSPKMF